MIMHLTVNGQNREVAVTGATRLIDVLRNQLALTGTKQGCGVGECGSCTVLVGGQPMQACILLASRVQAPVCTIEGLDDRFTPLRQAFADHGGFQCGFCTPGQIMRAAGLLIEAPLDRLNDEHWLREQMNGNICRCTGYCGIAGALMSDAVQALARRLRQAPSAVMTAMSEIEN
ncbi:(2Fe-2S)-binding protein [Rhizobium sp. BR 314]|uniref:(2Fe-2S)-binding protein n=1 Tax=Rhizobium sp. BR 314 TaxID=3040013 RepID=UPI0039BFEDEA